jgi:hypothetical protein
LPRPAQRLSLRAGHPTLAITTLAGRTDAPGHSLPTKPLRPGRGPSRGTTPHDRLCRSPFGPRGHLWRRCT